MSRIVHFLAFHKITLIMLGFATFTAALGYTEIAAIIAIFAFLVPHIDSLNERISDWESGRGAVNEDKGKTGVVYNYQIPARSVRTFAGVAISGGLLGISSYFLYHHPRDLGLWLFVTLMVTFFIFFVSFAVGAVLYPTGLGMWIDSEAVYCSSPWPMHREWKVAVADIQRVLVWKGEVDRMVFELKDGRKLRAPMHSFGPSASPALEALRSVAPHVQVKTLPDTWPALIGFMSGRDVDLD